MSEQHDNSTEMWQKYYSSKRGKPYFEKIIHFGRKVYFGGAFAKTIIKLGGKADSYLETGVGTGQTLEILERVTGAKCTGIEKTPSAYQLGKEYAKKCNIILGDALAISDRQNHLIFHIHLVYLNILVLKSKESFYLNKRELLEKKF